MEYVLMREEREVLEFDIDLATGEVRDARLLEGAPWAPPGVLDRQGRADSGLSQFIDSRSISPMRADAGDILQATGARSSVELAFRSGGFSLSDPYWYRARGSALTWASGNFFDNDWDPSFGIAVLRKDYDALGKASPVTPDVTCSGASRKAWLRDAKGPRLLKAPVGEGRASAVGEVLASRMLARLLPESEFVPYELVEWNGETLSACRPMLGPGEELVAAWQALSEAQAVPGGGKPPTDILGDELLEGFGSALARLGIVGGVQVIAKMSVFTHLTFNRDMHPTNLGIIRTGSGAFRLAPFFDFDRTFALSQRDRIERICTKPQLALLLMAKVFSRLDPSWDYSWYDRRALCGFEHEIERMIGTCEDLPGNYAQLAANLFAQQRTYVNRVAAGSSA